MVVGLKTGGGAAWLLAFSLCSKGAAQDIRVGTFEDQERPIYLEIDRMVEGETYQISLRGVPEGSKKRWILYFSTKCEPEDLRPVNVPGHLGPAKKGRFYRLFKTTEVTALMPKRLAGKKFYVQAFVKTPMGGRLTPMVEIIPTSGDEKAPPEFQMPIPLVTQEVLYGGRQGSDRDRDAVQVGVPFPKGAVFEEKAGVPALRVAGAPSYQASTLDQWPDGSVKWALVEYIADVQAGVWDRSYEVHHGSGRSGGEFIAARSGNRVTLDTGVVSVVLDGDSSELYESVKRGGHEVLDLTRSNRLVFFDEHDDQWTFHPGSIKVRRNGPVRGEVQVDGSFTRDGDRNQREKIFVRLYVEAAKNQPWIKTRVSLRNSSADYRRNLMFRGLSARLFLKGGNTWDVKMPKVELDGYSTSMRSGSLAKGDVASMHEGFVQHSDYSFTSDHNDGAYKPFVQRFTPDNFAQEGVQQRIGDEYFTGSKESNWFSGEARFADPFFMQVNDQSSGSGMTASFERAAYYWPVKMSHYANGQLDLELFPIKDASDEHLYPLTFGTCETRTFILWPEESRIGNPILRAEQMNYPLAARAPTWAYNQSDVWTWDLVSPDELKRAYDHMGLKPGDRNTDPLRPVYRFAGGTGGGNNSWRSTRAFNQWLRTGNGAAYQLAQNEAEYKVDKMACSFDDGNANQWVKPENENDATRYGKFWDGSKHTFLQSVHDVGFGFGNTYCLDSARHFAETFLYKELCAVRPDDGGFVAGTYGAVSCSTVAILHMLPDEELEDYSYKYMNQWARIVFGKESDVGVDTSKKGWQADPGTPVGSEDNPDGYFITKAAGKSSDWADFGYTIQIWTDFRLASRAYSMWAHYLEEHRPGDPLIDVLNARAHDMYHFARRAAPDDHCETTGEFYKHDVFPGDGGDPYPDKFLHPGDLISNPKPTGYALHGWINFYLDQQESVSARSYGVEMIRSMSDSTNDKMVHDPILNDFVYRYLRHYGLLDDI